MTDSLKPVQSKLLYPILISLALLFVGFFVLLNTLQQRYSGEASDKALRAAQQVFENSLSEQLNLLQLLAELIADASTSPNAFNMEDAQQLSQAYTGQFLAMRTRYDISHFYFHTTEGINILRLHEPSHFGDRIERYTMRQAILTNQPSSGIELGVLGTLTLRVVVPIKSDNGTVGFVEMGKELQTTFAILEDLLGLQLAMLLDKQHVTQAQWDRGTASLSHPMEWELLPQQAVYYGRQEVRPLLTTAYTDEQGLGDEERANHYKIDQHYWRQFSFPIRSADGIQIGQLVLFRDITDEQVAINQSIVLFYSVATGLFIVLLVLLRLALRRLDGQIYRQQQALRDSEEGLLSAQHIARLGSWYVDADLRHVTVSNTLYSLLKITPGTPINAKHWFLDYCPDEDKAKVAEKYTNLLKSSHPVELTHRMKSGCELIHVQQRCTAVYDAKGKLRGYSGTIQDISDAVSANNERLAQEKEFRQLLESTSAIPWKMDPDSLRFVYVGPQAERESGYPIKTWLSADFWRDHINPQDLYKLGLCRQETKLGHPYSFEFRLRDVQNNDVWFSTDAALNEQGQLQGFMFNVTARRKQELILKEIASGVAREVGEDFLLDLSRQIHKIFGCDYVLVAKSLSLTELESIVLLHRKEQRPSQGFSIDHTPLQQTLLQSSCVIQNNVSSRFPHDSTSQAWGIESFVGEALTNSEGQVIGVIAMFNTTPFEESEFASEVLSIFAARAAVELEQSQTKLRLAQKEMESREILNAMTDSVITIDEHGSVLSVNDATETIFGWSPAELIGKNVNILMPSDIAQQHNQYLSRHVTGGEIRIVGTNRGLIAHRKNGESFPIRLTVSELPAEQGGPRRFIGTCVDITDQQEQEEMLQRTKKMDALGKLTGGVAHDYNNILGIIMGYAELIDQMLDDASPCKDANKEIYQAAKRGARLAQKLLSFSRKQPRKTGICDLNDQINEQRDMLQTSLTSRVSLALHCSENLWPVNLDASDFDDALLNMVINAQHAMEGRQGTVEIFSSNITLDESESGRLGVAAGDYVCIEVCDDGKGMDNATKVRVFEPFFTTKGEDGTGLGLSSVYGFVQRCSGTIDLDSEPGKGSRFALYFPRAGGQLRSDSGDAPTVTDAQGIGNILVVDDEAALAHMAAQFLQSKGYKTTFVESAHDALKALAEHPYDLVFSDVVMPVMDGFELAENIQQRYPNVYVLLTSGYNENKRHASTERYDILSKPYSLADLQNRIQTLLNAKTTGVA